MKPFKVPGINFSWRHDGQDHPPRDPYRSDWRVHHPPSGCDATRAVIGRCPWSIGVHLMTSPKNLFSLFWSTWRAVLKMFVRLFRIKASESLDKNLARAIYKEEKCRKGEKKSPLQLKVLLRSNLGICFWLHISKMYVKVTYRAKFGVQIWSGSVFICTAIFVNVLPPSLDSNYKKSSQQLLSCVIATRDWLFCKTFSPLFCFAHENTSKNFSKKLYTIKIKKKRRSRDEI